MNLEVLSIAVVQLLSTVIMCDSMTNCEFTAIEMLVIGFDQASTVK
jgi:hypothetical protein